MGVFTFLHFFLLFAFFWLVPGLLLTPILILQVVTLSMFIQHLVLSIETRSPFTALYKVGFMWGVSEDAKYNYPYQTGPEIQILDPAIYDNPSIALGGDMEINNAIEDLETHKHFVGALYDLSAPGKLNMARPAKEWNSYHIKIDYKANRGEVILNDVLINSFPLQGPEWDAMLKTSKFSKSESVESEYLGDARWYDFGKYSRGHICFQDHPGEVSFRNIMIRELD